MKMIEDGCSTRKIESATGIPKSTISRWYQDFQEGRQRKADEYAAKTDELVKGGAAVKGFSMESTAEPSAARPDDAQPLDRMAGIASSVRAIGKQLESLAADIESVAFDVEARSQQIAAGEQKLKQVQELMKSLVGAAS